MGSLGFLHSPALGSLPLHSSNKSSRKNQHSVKQLVRAASGSQKLLERQTFLFASRIAIHRRVQHGSMISALVTDDSSTMTSIEEETDNIDILGIDPGLESFSDHFRYRMKRYVDQKALLEKYEGGLEEFSQGYLKFGFNREEGGIVYREWAPTVQEAQLVGDFNGWDGANHKMEKNQFGVWSIRLPDSDGNPAIPHNSKVKFRFQHGNGVWVDRIPAWIKYATVDPTRFGAPYDGVYWDLPPSERCKLLNPIWMK